MDNPLTGFAWLTSRHRAPADFLRGLARGEIPLTHEAFRTLQPWRAAAHLRELLMACRLLPAVDKQILLFERWLHQHLADVADPDHAQLLHCTQADVEAWAVEHNVSDRVNVRAFLQWSAANRLSRRFELPAARGPGGKPLPERDRTALLGRLLTDDRAPLRTRVAAAILLLYAQPVSRITRLSIDDVIRDGDQVLLGLGNPPTPVPEPVAGLLLEYLGQRTNMRTASTTTPAGCSRAAAQASRSSPAGCRR